LFVNIANEPTVNFLKITVATDYVLKPGNDIITRLNLNLRPTDLAEYCFIEKDSFLRPRRLICVELPFLQNGHFYIRLKNVGHRRIFVIKNSTIGNLEKTIKMDMTKIPIYCVTEEERDSELVSIADHNLANIDDVELRHKLETLLLEYRDVFSKSPKYMGKTDVIEHEIDVGDAKPKKQKAYRVSQKEREIIDQQIVEMERNDIIRMSNSPWSSPVVLVKKKSGETRFCVENHKVNNVTIKNFWSSSNIDDMLTYLGNAKYFSSLDMYSGYWQVKVKEECKPLTAFTAPGHGLWEFNVMPFGLCNAPATFQQLGDVVFRDLKWREILIYMDDIIIFQKQ